jgi:uncharacterized membrane protein YeaQ/YmgE (transglycosylase-associated protein family)
MLEALKPVAKTIAAFIVTAAVGWFASKGFNIPADAAGWMTSGLEAAISGIVGAAVVYFVPNKTTTA